MAFSDRAQAGRDLAEVLGDLASERPVVLGMARGGVPVARAIADRLSAELDVLVVRKLGHPHQPELGLGAIGEDGVRVLNEALMSRLGVKEQDLEQVAKVETEELRRRLALYRGGRHPVDIVGRTVVVVDDGLATGSTARAAIEIARTRGAQKVVLAVPVAPPKPVEELKSVADDVRCLVVTEGFIGISQWYDDFTQTTDDEVARLLAQSSGGDPQIVVGDVALQADLVNPPGARGVVVFAHGSDSSRFSPRNKSVAAVLNKAGFATLLFDLLTSQEAKDRANVFDIPLLAERLIAAVRWAEDELAIPVGLFGASTGAAAALVAATTVPVRAIVSRGGRPDLAGDALGQVRAPTLLIVGGADTAVFELNQDAKARMSAPAEIAVVPGAGHLFEEPGALESVADMAVSWFEAHLQ